MFETFVYTIDNSQKFMPHFLFMKYDQYLQRYLLTSKGVER